MNARNARIAGRRTGLVTWNIHDERAPPSAKFCLRRMSAAGGRRRRAQSAPRAWPMQLRPALPLRLAGRACSPRAAPTGARPGPARPAPQTGPQPAPCPAPPTPSLRTSALRAPHRSAPRRRAFRTGSAPRLHGSSARGALAALPPTPAHSPSLSGLQTAQPNAPGSPSTQGALPLRAQHSLPHPAAPCTTQVRLSP